MIREIGLDDKSDVYITSPVKYFPKKGTPSAADITHGRVHLMRQLAIIQPKVVVLLGRVAAWGVLQRKVAVVKDRGRVINEQDGVKYLLTLHPAAALRFPRKFISSLRQDFLQAKKLAGR